MLSREAHCAPRLCDNGRHAPATSPIVLAVASGAFAEFRAARPHADVHAHGQHARRQSRSSGDAAARRPSAGDRRLQATPATPSRRLGSSARSPAPGSTGARATLTARTDHAVARLRDGRVMVAGGVSSFSACQAIATAEIYDPSSAAWSAAEIRRSRSAPERSPSRFATAACSSPAAVAAATSSTRQRCSIHRRTPGPRPPA